MKIKHFNTSLYDSDRNMSYTIPFVRTAIGFVNFKCSFTMLKWHS